jgi:hypothetical protein
MQLCRDPQRLLAFQAHAEALGNDITPDMKGHLQDAYAKLGYHRLSDAAKDI